MEVAGLAAAQIAATLYDGTGDITIICGRGNNGGDGLVVARHLTRWDLPVNILVVQSAAKQENSESEVAINLEIIESCGLPVDFISASDLELVRAALAGSSLIIDALLGTGLNRPLEGIYPDLIDLINESGETVLSIDIPSGINADTGQVMGVAVEADATITFGHLKAGQLHYPGAQHCGEITLIDIGLPNPDALPECLIDLVPTMQEPQWWLASHQQVADWLISRRANAHKGTFGRLLCIAGSASMSGAAMLSSRTALRTGSGIAVLATAKSVIDHLPPEEIIYRRLSETEFGTINHAAISELETEIDQCQAILIGPGLSSNVQTIKTVQELLSAVKKPCIVDADALNALAQSKQFVLGSPKTTVFTPHPKELSRLLGICVEEIQQDRTKAAEGASKKFGCNIVLKGAHTVVATVEHGTYIIPGGNSGMATAGAGDVLSGVIGSFLAQGMDAGFAAIAGAYIHAAAGDLAAFSHGEDGMVASNIMEAVPVVLADLRADEFAGTELEQMILSI